MNYLVDGFSWKKAGFFSAMKRLLSAAIELNYPDNIYFNLISKNYCGGHDCFDVLFNRNETSKYNFINKNSKITPYLNSGISNSPSINQRINANKAIKKYFKTNEETNKVINDCISKTITIDFSDLHFVGHRGGDKSKESTIPNYTDYWKYMSDTKKYFIMSDEENFIKETEKRFRCLYLDCQRCDNNEFHPPHNLIKFDANRLRILYTECIIASKCSSILCNYSNTFDYISFLNCEVSRLYPK